MIGAKWFLIRVALIGWHAFSFVHMSTPFLTSIDI
jgi:hypothetical protein